MVEDKRISKSKQALRSALIQLLQECSFEELTVIQICSKANVSRITFYAHYTDKYKLASEVIHQFMVETRLNFANLQSRLPGSSQDIIALMFHNLLDCFLGLLQTHLNFFQYVNPQHSAYLYAEFSQQLLMCVNHLVESNIPTDQFRYPVPVCTRIIGFHLLGFSMEALSAGRLQEEDIRCFHRILQDLLDAHVLLHRTSQSARPAHLV